jgi:hypothetical protein
MWSQDLGKEGYLGFSQFTVNFNDASKFHWQHFTFNFKEIFQTKEGDACPLCHLWICA